MDAEEVKFKTQGCINFTILVIKIYKALGEVMGVPVLISLY